MIEVNAHWFADFSNELFVVSGLPMSIAFSLIEFSFLACFSHELNVRVLQCLKIHVYFFFLIANLAPSSFIYWIWKFIKFLFNEIDDF